MIKAVLFDCFGVLYPDTYWALVNTFVPDWEKTDAKLFHGIVERVDSGESSRDDFWNETAKACKVSRAELEVQLKKLGTLDSEVLGYIASLRGRGYKTGMLSNIGRGFIDRMFEGMDISFYFDDLVLSSEVGVSKPDPKVYNLAAERLKVQPEECVFIDDRAPFCEGARAVGMQALVYTSLNKLKTELEPLLS